MSSPWYRTRNGRAIVSVYIGFVIFAAVVSTGEVEAFLVVNPVLEDALGGFPVLEAVPDLVRGLVALLDLPDEVQRVRPLFYVAGAVGVVLWGLRAIVHRGDQSVREEGTADGEGTADEETTADRGSGAGSRSAPTLLTGEPMELLFRPFAVFPLVAGAVLLSGSLAAESAGPSATAAVALALFVGLFLDRVYDRLGRIADSLRRTDRDVPTSASAGSEWWHDRRGGRVLVAVYLAAAVVVLAVTAEYSPLAGRYAASLPVPLDVYLYAFIGMLGRIFTGVLRDARVSTEKLKAWGVRIPMAMLLAGVVYLVLQLPFETFSSPYQLSGLAFLVGLYEGVGFHYVAGVGEQLLPTADEAARRGAAESEAPPSDGPSSEAESSDADTDAEQPSEAPGSTTGR